MGGAGSPRRLVRRLALVGAVACVAAWVALPAAGQEDDAPAPDIWHGAASASPLSVAADREALLPVPNVLQFALASGESAFETDRQTARASLLFPGEGVLQGPNLVCGTFGGAFPPEFGPVLDACSTYEYPLTVVANASQADASTAGRLQLGSSVDPVSGLALGANAHAASDGSSTRSAVADVQVLGLPGIDLIPLLPIEQLQLDPAVVAIGGASSETDQRIEDGVLVVEASSRLTGVRLVGGLVNIGSIRSTSRITDDAEGGRTADADLEVGGVTVAGLPAQITDDGLVLGSPTGVLGPIQQQLASVLNPLLDALGVRIALLDTTETLDGTDQAVASAAGVLVEITLNVDGLPSVPGPLGDIDLNGAYVGSVQLGATGASGAAFDFGVDDPAVDDGSGGAFEPASDPGGGFGGGGDLPEPGGDPEAPTPTVSPPAAEQPAASLTDVFDGRLELLYAAMALTVLAICIAPGVALPARFPGPTS